MSCIANTPEMLWDRYVVDEETGCWLYTKGLNAYGYGQFRYNNKNVSAHRLAYELTYGPIPDGLCIDHVWVRGCRYHNCINPSHLEVVTYAENSARGVLARRTHCYHGHPFSEENTYMALDRNSMTYYRRCIICLRATKARFEDRRKRK